VALGKPGTDCSSSSRSAVDPARPMLPAGTIGRQLARMQDGCRRFGSEWADCGKSSADWGSASPSVLFVRRNAGWPRHRFARLHSGALLAHGPQAGSEVAIQGVAVFFFWGARDALVIDRDLQLMDAAAVLVSTCGADGRDFEAPARRGRRIPQDAARRNWT